MFNIGKILLFVMITGLAFLFYMVIPFLPLWCQGLITVHRIKTVLTLLSPIIFGAITAYIAYQQHLLARTQANISKDQRDIAHNKVRLEYYEKLISIFNTVCSVYRLVSDLDFRYPSDLSKQVGLMNTKASSIAELSRSGSSENTRQWASDRINEFKNIEEQLDKCWMNEQECKFILDKETHNVLVKFVTKARAMFDLKVGCMDMEMIGHRATNSIEKIESLNDELEGVFDEISDKMTPYMDISDIIAPRKFD